VFHFFECRFEIMKKQRNQVMLVKVTPLSATAPGLTQHKEAYA